MSSPQAALSQPSAASHQSELAFYHSYVDHYGIADQYLHGGLPLEEHDEFRVHLSQCPECYDRLQLAEMFQHERRPAAPPSPQVSGQASKQASGQASRRAGAELETADASAPESAPPNGSTAGAEAEELSAWLASLTRSELPPRGFADPKSWTGEDAPPEPPASESPASTPVPDRAEVPAVAPAIGGTPMQAAAGGPGNAAQARPTDATRSAQAGRRESPNLTPQPPAPARAQKMCAYQADQWQRQLLFWNTGTKTANLCPLPRRARIVASLSPTQLSVILIAAVTLLLALPSLFFLWELSRLRNP